MGTIGPPPTHLADLGGVPPVADPGGGAEGVMAPPGPVKTSHKKDGHQRWPHRFHASRPPYPTAGSATGP